MAWKVNFDATEDREAVSVALDDMPPAVFDAIALGDPDGTWWGVYTWPGASFGRLYKVICAAAKIAGVDPPPEPVTMTASRDLLNMLDQVEDVEEKPMVDGFPQTPDAPEVGSTSGVPGDSDGPPTSSEDNESVTS